MNQFSSLHLNAPLLKALIEEGYETPTPIQAKAIPPILEGRDILGCAQTGTGKTAAFALPILHRLMAAPIDKTQRGPRLPRVIVLAPTRELCTQIGESFATYGRHSGLNHVCIFGGVSQYHQVKALERGVDIIVATPGRLIDLMNQRRTNFSKVAVFVLDEADRMLDMGFIAPIRHIAAAVPHATARQTLLFSATMPKEIVRLAESLLSNPVRVAVTPVASTVPKIQQSVYHVPRMKKQALLEHLLHEGEIERALVFTRTKHGADKVHRRLLQAGITSEAIHGDKAQNRRQRALDGFRNGRSRVLVATDVAARGLDVDGITHVFNFDLPNEPEAYVHRIGRTGRAGAAGIAISFCDGEESVHLRDIERLTGKRLDAVTKLPQLADIPAREHTPPHARSNAAPVHSDSRRFEAKPARPGRGHHGSRQTFGASAPSDRPHPPARENGRTSPPPSHRQPAAAVPNETEHAPAEPQRKYGAHAQARKPAPEHRRADAAPHGKPAHGKPSHGKAAHGKPAHGKPAMTRSARGWSKAAKGGGRGSHR